MLSYLQANTLPDIYMVTHQTALFTIDPRLSHKKAVNRIGKYLRCTPDQGIIYNPDRFAGLDNANHAGGCNSCTSTDASNLFSRTGYIIKYDNCPIYWKSKLQREIALSTCKAEYLPLSAALREVLPLITMMKELKSSFPELYLPKPDFHCKIWEDNQSYIAIATSKKFSP